MKVPIRSKMTFCVSCSKSFKVHFKYKKYFIEDCWVQSKGLEAALPAYVQWRFQTRFLQDAPRREKKEWGMEVGDAPAHTWQTMSAGGTCIFDHPSRSFLHFNGGSFTRGVQFTMSCHGFHLHNSRNALFMWSAAFLHRPEMGFFLDHNSRSISVYITRLYLQQSSPIIS